MHEKPQGLVNEMVKFRGLGVYCLGYCKPDKHDYCSDCLNPSSEFLGTLHLPGKAPEP